MFAEDGDQFDESLGVAVIQQPGESSADELAFPGP